MASPNVLLGFYGFGTPLLQENACLLSTWWVRYRDQLYDRSRYGPLIRGRILKP